MMGRLHEATGDWFSGSHKTFEYQAAWNAVERRGMAASSVMDAELNISVFRTEMN